MGKSKGNKNNITKAFKSHNTKRKFCILKEYYENLEAASELLVTCDKDYNRYYLSLFKKSFNDLKKAK
ncbi:MAG: hypothetical protein IH949_08850 [Bacteroidetes bacterium]|nr:hypothetical protein [Bacteroidota bacterium]